MRDDITRDKIQAIAESETGRFMVQYFEKVKDTIADVRYGPQGLTNDARVAAIKAIDELLVDKFRVLKRDEREPLGDDSME